MSIVDDQVWRLDGLLDRYHVLSSASRRPSLAADASIDLHQTAVADRLKTVIRQLSTTSSSSPLLKRKRLRHLLHDIQKDHSQSSDEVAIDVEDSRWLATAKGAIQLQGLVLRSLLEQTMPLRDSIEYWDDVVGSDIRTGLYMLQTSPLRLWDASKEIYRDVKSRDRSSFSVRDAAQQSGDQFQKGWQDFWGLVRQSFRDRSLVLARTRVLSPFALQRTEAGQKQRKLKRLREQSAAAIGLLLHEGLPFPSADYEAQDIDWEAVVQRSITTLESVLHHSKSMDGTMDDYEYNVIEAINATESNDRTSQLATRLLHILDRHLPEQEKSARTMAQKFGKPPRWIRYWMPGLILFISGTTLLRILTNRRAEIATWIREAGQTTIDFWYNWVLEPTKRLIGTIRHDEASELAIMSRDSLRSDRDSLERMVVDFVVENPEGGRAYTASDIESIRSKVADGDLTPVLRAYEQEMKSPLVRAITGNLIRVLLIQIQKTKVDVEVAIGGIDSLLKSQELLFGFVGVAPAIVVSYFTLQWLRDLVTGRSRREKNSGVDTVRILRNIDRTLANGASGENGILSYKDYGLLFCEVHVLRQRTVSRLPGRMRGEMLEDIDDLLDVQKGVLRQKEALSRIRRTLFR